MERCFVWHVGTWEGYFIPLPCVCSRFSPTPRDGQKRRQDSVDCDAKDHGSIIAVNPMTENMTIC